MGKNQLEASEKYQNKVPQKNSEKVCLIIPCYNESDRINLDDFLDEPSIIFVFVNDGSTDNSADIIRKITSDRIFLVDLAQNSGKGEAVRQGVLFAKTQPFFSQLDWVGFWDADLSTPLAEVPHFISFANMYHDPIDSIWGSRLYRLGSNINRSFIRHFLGRLFATLIKIVLNVEGYDTQCGAKLFKPDLMNKAFGEPFISKWIFDVEILLRLSGNNIIEYPLSNWVDVKGSKLNVIKESLRILTDVIKIKLMKN